MGETPRCVLVCFLYHKHTFLFTFNIFITIILIKWRLKEVELCFNESIVAFEQVKQFDVEE